MIDFIDQAVLVVLVKPLGQALGEVVVLEVVAEVSMRAVDDGHGVDEAVELDLCIAIPI